MPNREANTQAQSPNFSLIIRATWSAHQLFEQGAGKPAYAHENKKQSGAILLAEVKKKEVYPLWCESNVPAEDGGKVKRAWEGRRESGNVLEIKPMKGKA